MATLREVKAKLRELGLENEYGYRAETRLIPESLEAGEHMLSITSGIREGRRWYLLITEGRLLLLSKPTMASPSLIAIPREEIRSIDGKKGLFFASVTVDTEQGSYSFSNVLKKSFFHFISTARN